ncbi:hypothetical protein [Nostoc sp. GT001]|uniref:hypothetical protein n=1 Tax=Nostoc sp. GT001 TaxID=3056647 RepID=UPI0025AAEB58|nr:hypothetical protein [Nostoc sp. GT001]MDM9583095.1 hypothetical protein [Nostoc sp. GT001]
MVKKKAEDPNSGDRQYCGGTGAYIEKDKGGEYKAAEDCPFCNGGGEASIYDAKRQLNTSGNHARCSTWGNPKTALAPQDHTASRKLNLSA